jgi:hypothetical protein
MKKKNMSSQPPEDQNTFPKDTDLLDIMNYIQQTIRALPDVLPSPSSIDTSTHLRFRINII